MSNLKPTDGSGPALVGRALTGLSANSGSRTRGTMLGRALRGDGGFGGAMQGGKKIAIKGQLKDDIRMLEEYEKFSKLMESQKQRLLVCC